MTTSIRLALLFIISLVSLIKGGKVVLSTHMIFTAFFNLAGLIAATLLIIYLKNLIMLTSIKQANKQTLNQVHHIRKEIFS